MNLKLKPTFLRLGNTEGSSEVGAQIFTSWSSPLVARIGAKGCGSSTLIWETKDKLNSEDVSRFQHIKI